MLRIAKNWREWLARYGWAELWGLITSYLGYFLTYEVSHSAAGASFGAAIGENVGYYFCIFLRDFSAERRAGHALSLPLAGKVLRFMMIEFGAAELLDSLIVRPASTYFAVALFGPQAGVLVGKIAADIVFYALTIGFYERRKALKVQK